jgi:hypothetical protein
MQRATSSVGGRGQRAVELILDSRERAIASVEECAEHVWATARLLDSPARFYSAQVVARATLEAAGPVRWLLKSDIAPDEIIARHLGRAREEQDRAIKFLDAASVSTPEEREQFALIRENIVQIKERTLAVITELGIEPVRVRPTTLAKHAGDPEEYDIYAGSTHGRLASFLETRKMAGDDAGSAVLFMNLVSVVAPAYVVAVQSLHEFVAGASIPADVLESVADSLGLKSDAFAPPDLS